MEKACHNTSVIFRRFWTLMLIIVLCLALSTAACAESDWSLQTIVEELTESKMPESAIPLIQPILHQETVNGVEITIQEAAYDGRTLLLQYSFRMPDVESPLGMTAAEAYGDWLPEGVEADQYVYSLSDDAEEQLYSHNVGWWMDQIWINGVPLDDMPDGSGQYLTGTDVPGELIETDVWRLDNVGVFLEGKAQISLPIGEMQDFMDYSYEEHPEKYDADGCLLLPDKGIVTFELDAGNIQSQVQVFRPETESILPEITAKVREAVFTPLMTYIYLDLFLLPEAMDAFIAENGPTALDENGEELWDYGPLDVFGSWIENLQLTDGSGTVLFPDNYGPSAYSDTEAEFLLPYLETLPEELYLAPVQNEGEADLRLAVRVL